MRRSRMQRLAAAMAALVMLTGCNMQGVSQREMGGAIVGAALGGLIGAQFGGGRGQLLLTGLGTAVGLFMGARIGRDLDAEDQRYRDRTATQALWEAPTGTTSSWGNPATGNSGQVTPVSDSYALPFGGLCRDFRDAVVFTDGTGHVADGTACAKDDGSWSIN